MFTQPIARIAGIGGHVYLSDLYFSPSERETLLRAADICAQARSLAGDDAGIGSDMAKAEAILREHVGGGWLRTTKEPA